MTIIWRQNIGMEWWIVNLTSCTSYKHGFEEWSLECENTNLKHVTYLILDEADS